MYFHLLLLLFKSFDSSSSIRVCTLKSPLVDSYFNIILSLSISKIHYMDFLKSPLLARALDIVEEEGGIIKIGTSEAELSLFLITS